RGRMPEPRIIARHAFRSACFSEAGDEPGSRAFVLSFATACGLGAEATLARVGPTSMRKPLSRSERDDCGTSQTFIRGHPRWRSAMRERMRLLVDATIQD